MKIVFCLEPFETNKVDFVYESEAESAKKVGFDVELIDYEILVRDGNAARATRFIKPFDNVEKAIYRGWMLKPEIYEKLYNLLLEKNLQLINSPTEYKNCHYLSECYKSIERHTPKTVFVDFDEKFDFEKVFEATLDFGNKPIIVKDFVKSRKHEWFEACFIPNASDKVKLKQIVEKFLELQGEDLNEGLAFREFIKFQSLTTHSKSGMPLTKEFRLFFLNGKMLFSSEYWEEGEYEDFEIPHKFFGETAKNVESNFFTMDIAQKENGEWLIVELGDAQVSGLPEKADKVNFYQGLFNNLA